MPHVTPTGGHARATPLPADRDACAVPPAAVIDALEASGRSDPKSAEWVVKLEKHYQKLDAYGG